MDGRQQALMFLESGEQERTLSGQEIASKGRIAVVLIGVSAVAEVVKRVERPIARVMEESSFMVACYRKGYRLLYVVMRVGEGKLNKRENEGCQELFCGTEKEEGWEPTRRWIHADQADIFLSFGVGL